MIIRSKQLVEKGAGNGVVAGSKPGPVEDCAARMNRGRVPSLLGTNCRSKTLLIGFALVVSEATVAGIEFPSIEFRYDPQ